MNISKLCRPVSDSRRVCERFLVFGFLLAIAPALIAATANIEDARSIARIYSAAFDRTPQTEGLNFWINSYESGRSLLDIAGEFYLSPEFKRKYGPLNDREYVEQLYRNVLGRPGENAGVEFWAGHLSNGTSRARILLEFSNSPENVNKTAGTYANLRSSGGRWVIAGRAFYSSPVRVSDILKFSAIAAGWSHTCAIKTSGETYCWGFNDYGQLGNTAAKGLCSDAMYPCTEVPVLVEGSHRFKQLVASQWHSCALDDAGAAFCWGRGDGGQLGDGKRTDSHEPVPVAGGLKFTALAATPASNATCGLTSAGAAWCWGGNSNGNLGNGTQWEGAEIPAPLMTSTKFISISIGQISACGVSSAHDALCWGNNWYGQLGIGSAGGSGGVADSYSPVAVLGGLKFEQIATDGTHVCAMQSDGTVYCWGYGADIGTGAIDSYVSLPVRVDYTGSPWVSLAVGYDETCAFTQAGALDCWGQGSSTMPISTGRSIVRIKSKQPFIAYTLGGSHACAIGADSFAYCWGQNYHGQVGRPPSDP
jgi:alpha-tubulin suppressor-like RCC1 family protein